MRHRHRKKKVAVIRFSGGEIPFTWHHDVWKPCLELFTGRFPNQFLNSLFCNLRVSLEFDYLVWYVHSAIIVNVYFNVYVCVIYTIMLVTKSFLIYIECHNGGKLFVKQTNHIWHISCLMCTVNRSHPREFPCRSMHFSGFWTAPFDWVRGPWAETIATSPGPLKGRWGSGKSLQGNLGWWNMIIWPDLFKVIV